MFESCRAHLRITYLKVTTLALASCAIALSVGASTAVADTGTGSFNSNDPLLDQIWTQSVRTATDMIVPGPLKVDVWDRPCAIDLPSVIIDGVFRDRCPYVGDEAVIGRTLDASTPDWELQRGMLEWFARAQHDDGAIPSSPIFDASSVLFDYNAYWVEALHNYVLYSGDTGLAREVWPNLVRLFDGFYRVHLLPNGLLRNDLGASDYAYIHRRGEVVAYYNAEYVGALRLAARIAGWIGESAAAADWTARAATTAAAFTTAFWDAGAGAFSDTTVDPATHPQDGNAFAVLSGIATGAQATSALGYLAGHDWRDYGNTIVDTDVWSGPSWGWQANQRVYPFMSYFELVARFRSRLDASALDLVRREWGYMVKHGPGTMWETIGPYGGPPTDIHPSYDSGWSSGAAPALTEYVLGVAPTSPGFATFTVRPHPGDLTHAAGTVPTPHGPIHVSWVRLAGAVFVRATAPPGTVWTRP